VKPQEFDFLCPYADGHTYLRKYPDDRSAWHLQIPADRLWVREAHARGTMNGGDREWVRYRATDESDVPAGTRWKPGIHLPRALARLVLEVTDVRLERLDAITEEDAVREGFRAETDVWWSAWDPVHQGYPEFFVEPTSPQFENVRRHERTTSARERFETTWRNMYVGTQFERAANPWVWVVSFRRVDAARSAA
jgi:hypothetical protein